MGTGRRLVAVLTFSLLASGVGVHAEDTLLAVADPTSPSAPPLAIPSPAISPGMKPLLPPEGLPTAPPPDQIKPIEPRGKPADPKTDPAAAETEPDRDYRYLAVIAGACDRLVVGDREVPSCADKLVNVDFGNGRVAFMFTGRVGDTAVITTFSGGASEQPGARTYHLAIDRMSTTTVGADTAPATVVVATTGDCTMAGDPTKEETRFECRARSDGKETLARFRTTGKPAVYAGTRRNGDPVGDRSADLETSARLALL